MSNCDVQDQNLKRKTRTAGLQGLYVYIFASDDVDSLVCLFETTIVHVLFLLKQKTKIKIKMGKIKIKTKQKNRFQIMLMFENQLWRNKD